MKFLFLFFTIVGSAVAFCPGIATVSDLDLENYMGMWQIHGIVNTSAPIGNMKCYMNMLSGENFGVEPVELNGHLMGEIEGVMEMKDVPIRVNELIAPGFWKWQEFGVEASAFIMFTDYAEYSLLLICRNNDDQHLEAHFMSRYHDPMPENIIDNFKEMLESYSIPVQNFRPIFHDHSCGH